MTRWVAECKPRVADKLAHLPPIIREELVLDKVNTRKVELRDIEWQMPDDAEHLDSDVPEITGGYFSPKNEPTSAG